MESTELETYEIGDKQYVGIRDAARWLHIAPETLLDQISLGKIETTQIESRQLIELEALKAYAAKHQQPKTGRNKIGE